MRRDQKVEDACDNGPQDTIITFWQKGQFYGYLLPKSEEENSLGISEQMWWEAFYAGK